jgi:methylated-DNA-[protein]-cysteine S-methyltransferase
VIHSATVGTPLGAILIAGREDAVTSIRFLDRTADPSPASGESAVSHAALQLEEYFAGRRTVFDVPLDPAGTPFQLEVWLALTEIPYGVVCSYGQLAGRLGRPTASRAVGAANGANPIPILLPCHRVIGATGSLTGYGGGLPRKRALLALEGVCRGSNPAGLVPGQRSLF